MSKREKTSLYIMAAFYVIAGINHFVSPVFYKKIMPPSVPWHSQFILLTGMAEIVLGILLLLPLTRRPAAWGIIILLIAIFPANLQMMLNYKQEHHPYLWIAVLRLPLQILLILWAYAFVKKKREVAAIS